MNARAPLGLKPSWSAVVRLSQAEMFHCQEMIDLAVSQYGDVPRQMIAMATSDPDDVDVRRPLSPLRRALSVLRTTDEMSQEMGAREVQEISVEVYSLMRMFGYTPKDSALGMLAALMKDTFHRKMDDSEHNEIGVLHTQISDYYSPAVANALCNMGLFGRRLSTSDQKGKENIDLYVDSIGNPVGGRDQERLEAQMLPLVITFVQLHHGCIANYELKDPTLASQYRALLAVRIDDVRNNRDTFLTLKDFMDGDTSPAPGTQMPTPSV